MTAIVCRIRAIIPTYSAMRGRSCTIISICVRNNFCTLWLQNHQHLCKKQLLYCVVPVVYNNNHVYQVVMHGLSMLDGGKISVEGSKSWLHVGAVCTNGPGEIGNPMWKYFNEVNFKSSDGSFCCIYPVLCRQNQLVLNVVFPKSCFQIIRAFNDRIWFLSGYPLDISSL